MGLYALLTSFSDYLVPTDSKPDEVVAKKITYILTIFSAYEMTKATNKHVVNNQSLQLSIQAPDGLLHS
jgi:hypothetical protein